MKVLVAANITIIHLGTLETTIGWVCKSSQPTVNYDWARTLFISYLHMIPLEQRVCVISRFSHVWLFAALWTIACQTLLSMGILQARILEWVAMPSTGIFPTQRLYSCLVCLLHWQVGSLPLVPLGTIIEFRSVQFSCSVMSSALRSHGPACQTSLSISNSQSLLKLRSIKLVMPSNHLILCCPLLLPSIFSRIKVFSMELVLCIKWLKYWSFSFSISPSNEYSGLISIRMDWLDHLAVQGTLKSLLQDHSSKASILHCSAFFIVQHSNPYCSWGSYQ